MMKLFRRRNFREGGGGSREKKIIWAKLGELAMTPSKSWSLPFCTLFFCKMHYFIKIFVKS